MNTGISNADDQLSEREHRAIARSALAALALVINDNREPAARLIEMIERVHGGTGLYVAMCAVADAYVTHVTGGKEMPKGAGLAMWNMADGTLRGVDSPDVIPAHAWAARLIHARAEWDRDAFDNICIEANSLDADAFSRHVGAVFELVAATVKTMPEGAATMGLNP